MANKKAEKERASARKEQTLNKGIPLHRGTDDATRKAVLAGLQEDKPQEDEHKKQRPLRRHAPKNAAAWKASPEEHPDDDKSRTDEAPNEDGHNSETAEKVK